jgi:hypothetical protein
MDSNHCKNLKVRPCTKLEKEKLCTVYTRDDKKKCRKYRKARELTEDNVIRARPLKRLQKSIPEPEPIKEPTTLEKVQAVWGGEESVQIAQDIDGLERYPVRSIKGLIYNETLRKELEREITTLPGDMDIHLDRYERMTTTEFVNLTSILNIDGVELKKNILDNIDKGVYVLYEEMENAVLKALESRKNNSSTVYVTSKNVMASEFIKKAGIDTFSSILNNFTNFNVLGKTSSSDSIVFNARFEPSKSVNSLRELNIPVTPLYFKIYPTKVSTGSVRRLIDNPGLEFEQSAYNKLFKLVQKNVTPNILCTAATSSNISGFSDFLESAKLSDATKKELAAQSKKINGGKWIETGVIITQPGGKTFYQLFVTLDAEEKRSVLFQLMYTLYVFEKIQFSHGDLHISNMFIIDVPKTELCYVIEGQQYRFSTRKLVKIYDFDHGTICKTTTIRVNRDSNFTITAELNETRDINNNLNTKYAETNIFNKNLDLLIFTNYLSYICPRVFDHFTISNSDTEVNNFFRECFPGFDSANPLSQVKIRDTYLTLLENESNRLEANRIFGLDANTAEEYTKYNVDNDVLNMTWMNYFRDIKNNFSRIVKNFNFDDENVPNNHLWIPDVVVLPRNMILENRYFDSFKSDELIDVRKMPVYTIDNRIM